MTGPEGFRRVRHVTGADMTGTQVWKEGEWVGVIWDDDPEHVETNRAGTVLPARTYATDREEHEPCQAGTPACSIDHGADRGSCETW